MRAGEDSFNTDSTKKTTVGLWSKTKTFVQSSLQGVKWLKKNQAYKASKWLKKKKKKIQMINGPYA